MPASDTWMKTMTNLQVMMMIDDDDPDYPPVDSADFPVQDNEDNSEAGFN